MYTGQGARYFMVQQTKMEKYTRTAIKYTKGPWITSKSVPKYTKIGIFGVKISGSPGYNGHVHTYILGCSN
jgi:hypothetical protein